MGGQIMETHSISAGLDYPGVGPQHAALKDSGRVKYVMATDQQALDAMQLCSRTEGIIPALEPSHDLHHAFELCKSRPRTRSAHELVRSWRQGYALRCQGSRSQAEGLSTAISSIFGLQGSLEAMAEPMSKSI